MKTRWSEKLSEHEEFIAESGSPYPFVLKKDLVPEKYIESKASEFFFLTGDLDARIAAINPTPEELEIAIGQVIEEGGITEEEIQQVRERINKILGRA